MKYIYSIVLLLFQFALFGQNMNQQTKAYFDTVEASKSGNYKDALTSFFQLFNKNITGENKSIGINTTLFAIKKKADPTIDQDIYFRNERFSRNFQFNFQLDLDNSYKYKGFTGGITYAIINARDKATADFTNYTYLHDHYIEVRNKISNAHADIIMELGNDSTFNLKEEIIQYGEMLNFLLNKRKINIDSLKDNKYYKNIIHKYNKDSDDDFNRNMKLFYTYKDSALADIEAKPLWTVSVGGTANEKGNFNKASLESIFLKGSKNAKSEWDIRSKLVYSDSLGTNKFQRLDFSLIAGINFKIYKHKNKESFFEVKGALEYTNALKDKLENEKRKTFFANTEIRVRIAKDLWIPLIVKYDIEKSNFLGFLNITYNFENFLTKND